MSGEIREKNSVRSDFAEDDTPTFAELVMQHNGEVYRIYRNPEYMRPKKRKNGKAAMTKERKKLCSHCRTGPLWRAAAR